MKEILMARRSPYVSASRMYRTRSVPGEYYLLSFIVNSIIICCQLILMFFAFIISFTPTVLKALATFFIICYRGIEALVKASYVYLSQKYLAFTNKSK